MTLGSAADIVSRMEQMTKAVSAAEMRKRMATVGKAVAPLATRAAASDLGGDAAFSGWRRGKPIRLAAKHTIHPDGMGVTIHRDKVSAGPWRVGEDGRNQGNASGFSGPGINHRTGLTSRTKSGGLRKVRATKARRSNGATAGKGVWSKAEAVVAPAAGKQIVKLNREAVLDAFRGKK